MEKAIISLSFDDGRKDNIDIVENVLLPKGIPATFNITTAYVDGTSNRKLPIEKPAMSKQDVIWLASQPGMEIALHGDEHLNTVEDISRGREKLIEWLGFSKEQEFGFASPGSDFDLNQAKNPSCDLYRKYVKYFRTSSRVSSKHKIRVFARKLGRIIKLPFLYRIAYKDTIMTKADGRIIYSVPILCDTTVRQVKSLIKKCISDKGAVTLMFHSVEQNVNKNRGGDMVLVNK